MSNEKLNSIKIIGYSAAAFIVVANIILWLALLWADSSFFSSRTYAKILITSVALVFMALLIAGFANFIGDESRLKKDKLIN